MFHRGVGATCTLTAALLTVAADPAAEEAPSSASHIEDGILDEIHLKAEKPAQGLPVLIRLFDSSKADLGTGAEGGKESRVQAAKKIQAEGPRLLAESFAAKSKKLGSFSDVHIGDGSEIPANALVVEGEFTRLDPGSRAKRYWGGFGAGKSGVEVKGRIVKASGEVLAEFAQKRIAVMGAFGGDYDRKLASDCRSIGEDIADFLDAWARGKALTD